LDRDAGFTGDDDGDLQRLDTFLCDLKEAQIRDGLHILGASPTGQQEIDLLVALTRVPRGLGENGDQSLIRALAQDFDLGFDPLDCRFSEEWTGPRPQELAEANASPWRSVGDTVERLEIFAANLVAESGDWRGNKSSMVLAAITDQIRPALQVCGPAELAALESGLAGRI
jgi:cobaltochelatase CobN